MLRAGCRRCPGGGRCPNRRRVGLLLNGPETVSSASAHRFTAVDALLQRGIPRQEVSGPDVIRVEFWSPTVEKSTRIGGEPDTARAAGWRGVAGWSGAAVWRGAT